MRNYDYSLDAIKGISCVLMIMAHTPSQFLGYELSYQFIGGLAPVLFFAVSGITAVFQAEKKDFRSLFKFYFAFSILGFSYNTMWNPDFLEGFQSDVPQIVALGVIGIFLIEKFIKPKLYIYLIAAVIIFFMHYFLNDLVPDLPLVSFIFYGVNFSFFPWFFTFLAGVYAYKCKNSNNLILSVLSLFSLIIFYLLFSPKYLFEKFDMSIGYFFLSSTILFIVFYIVRLKENFNNYKFILYIGKNSFLFLYIHLFIINTFTWLNLFNFHIIFIWSITLIGSYLITKLVLWVNPHFEYLFDYKMTWFILVLLTVLTPYFISYDPVTILVETFVGLAFSSNYKKLSKITATKITNKNKTIEKKDCHESLYLSKD